MRLPKKWWPKHWHGKYERPVCRLDYALHGHPKAGDIWGDRLEQVLIDERGFKSVEGWPSVYVKHFPAANGVRTGSAAASPVLRQGVLLIIAYVDDLLFLGTEEMGEEIRQIRRSINMDEPAPLKKYSGCTHHVIKETQKDGSVLTKCEYDMCDALVAAVRLYVSTTDQRLKTADSLYPPDIGEKELTRLFE